MCKLTVLLLISALICCLIHVSCIWTGIPATASPTTFCSVAGRVTRESSTCAGRFSDITWLAMKLKLSLLSLSSDVNVCVISSVCMSFWSIPHIGDWACLSWRKVLSGSSAPEIVASAFFKKCYFRSESVDYGQLLLKCCNCGYLPKRKGRSNVFFVYMKASKSRDHFLGQLLAVNHPCRLLLFVQRPKRELQC